MRPPGRGRCRLGPAERLAGGGRGPGCPRSRGRLPGGAPAPLGKPRQSGAAGARPVCCRLRSAVWRLPGREPPPRAAAAVAGGAIRMALTSARRQRRGGGGTRGMGVAVPGVRVRVPAGARPQRRAAARGVGGAGSSGARSPAFPDAAEIQAYCGAAMGGTKCRETPFGMVSPRFPKRTERPSTARGPPSDNKFPLRAESLEIPPVDS